MREILFRGKQVNDGKWYESGDIVQIANFVMLYSANIGNEWVSVIPETVGHYTGLTDKNGKKIFEGDILKVEITAVVKYKETKAAFFVETFDGEEEYLGEAGVEEAEVIGNIHDNPELLNGR